MIQTVNQICSNIVHKIMQPEPKMLNKRSNLNVFDRCIVVHFAGAKQTRLSMSETAENNTHNSI